MNNLLKALSIASLYHKDQKRKGAGGSPYINHLIEVAFLLSEIAGVTDSEVLQAAVLHDILEDTDISEEQLAAEFGSPILEYVKYLTDDKSLSLEERRQWQLDRISTASKEVKLIKLADHCSNISSIPPSWDSERVRKYFEWSHLLASSCFDADTDLANEYKKRYKVSKEK